MSLNRILKDKQQTFLLHVDVIIKEFVLHVESCTGVTVDVTYENLKEVELAIKQDWRNSSLKYAKVGNTNIGNPPLRFSNKLVNYEIEFEHNVYEWFGLKKHILEITVQDLEEIDPERLWPLMTYGELIKQEDYDGMKFVTNNSSDWSDFMEWKELYEIKNTEIALWVFKNFIDSAPPINIKNEYVTDYGWMESIECAMNEQNDRLFDFLLETFAGQLQRNEQLNKYIEKRKKEGKEFSKHTIIDLDRVVHNTQ